MKRLLSVETPKGKRSSSPWSEKDRFVFLVCTSHRHTSFFSRLTSTGRQAAHFSTVQGIEIGREVADVCTDDVSFFFCSLKAVPKFLFTEAYHASSSTTWMTDIDYSVRTFIHLQIYVIFYKWRNFHGIFLHFSFFKMNHRAFSPFRKHSKARYLEREHRDIIAWRGQEQGSAQDAVDCRRRENYPTKRKPPCQRHGGPKNISQNENLS